MVIAVHQEDVRGAGFIKKPYIDVGIALLGKRSGDSETDLVQVKDFQITRNCELEAILDPGVYFIIPRTTGCMLDKTSACLANPQDQIMNCHTVTSKEGLELHHKTKVILKQVF